MEPGPATPAGTELLSLCAWEVTIDTYSWQMENGKSSTNEDDLTTIFHSPFSTNKCLMFSSGNNIVLLWGGARVGQFLYDTLLWYFGEILL